MELDGTLALPLLLLLLLFLLVVYILGVLSSRDMRNEIALPQKVKGHHWLFVAAFPPGKYCNVCETSTFHGACCEHCGVIVDEECVRRADAAIPCKQMACISGSPMRHHWVSGNLAPTALCDACESLCDYGPGLNDFHCVWCNRSVHAKCLSSVSSICDFGKLKRMVIPPNCVKLRMVGWKGNRHFVVKEVSKPEIPGWSPVLVICNRKSGNGDGDHVLQAFRRLLNPAQVLDLSKSPPERALEWCRLMKDSDVRCRILVAGGDGTVGWVLDAIESLGIQPQPELFLFPLGTGNDLSRVLGWGPGHTGPVEGMQVLQDLASSQSMGLDRWSVSVRPESGRRLLGPSERDLSMSAYASIGVDAMVTLNFHRARYELPSWLMGRLANKLLFFHYGTKDLVERTCFDLDKKLEVFLDGEKVELPNLESIVVMNIGSWGAGVRPWELCKCSQTHPNQSFNDGLLEVIGISSSFHIAQMQVGLSEPLRLGQAHDIVIKYSDPDNAIPMQVDGEPFLERSASIRIRQKGQARVLVNPTPPPESVLKRSLSALFNNQMVSSA